MTSEKRCFNSTKSEEDFLWVYWSHKHRVWMCKICEMYPTTGQRSKGVFSTRPTSDTAHPGLSISTHGNSKRHKQLEMKYFVNSEDNVFKKMSKNAESTLCKKHHVNSFNLRKCIHTLFFLIQYHFALVNNYEDLIGFASSKIHEPIINQYLDNCLKNATYKSNTSVESLLDAMNTFFEMKNLGHIKDAQFLTIYADEAENLSHRETSAILLTYFSELMECLKTKCFGILKLDKTNAADIMD